MPDGQNTGHVLKAADSDERSLAEEPLRDAIGQDMPSSLSGLGTTATLAGSLEGCAGTEVTRTPGRARKHVSRP